MKNKPVIVECIKRQVSANAVADQFPPSLAMLRASGSRKVTMGKRQSGTENPAAVEFVFLVMIYHIPTLPDDDRNPCRHQRQ